MELDYLLSWKNCPLGISHVCSWVIKESGMHPQLQVGLHTCHLWAACGFGLVEIASGFQMCWEPTQFVHSGANWKHSSRSVRIREALQMHLDMLWTFLHNWFGMSSRWLWVIKDVKKCFVWSQRWSMLLNYAVLHSSITSSWDGILSVLAKLQLVHFDTVLCVCEVCTAKLIESKFSAKQT